VKSRYFWLWIGGVFGLIMLETASQAKKTSRKLSLSELQALSRSVGFPDPELAAAVAMAESGGNPGAVAAEPHGGPSYGLWQIHASDHPEFSTALLLDPTYNARTALAISKNGTDWSPWSAFKSRDYLRYMPGVS
jgi:soluble lytic murein transglycosylase-like protein